jgi:FG-GAP-like repeat/FG-GAP repeat
MTRGGKLGTLALSAALIAAVAAVAGSGGTEIDRYRVGEHPIGIAVGDFNRDGRADLAVSNFQDQPRNTLSILRGRRGGEFARPKTIKLGATDQPDAIVVTRIGKGKDQDLVVGTLATDVLVLKGKKGARFAKPRRLEFGVSSNPREVAAGDFDRDGLTDLAVNQQGPNQIAVLLGEGGLNFAPPVPYGAPGTGGSETIAARLDPGNDLDLLTIDYGNDGVALLRGEGGGTFGFPEALNPGDEAFSIEVADLNRDGRNDIVAGLAGDRPRLGVSRGEAGGTFAPQAVQTLGQRPMVIDDIAVTRLNGDNDPDLVIVGREVGGVRAAHRRGDPGPLGESRVIFLRGQAGVGLKRVREINFTHDATAVATGRFDGGGADAAVTRYIEAKRGQVVVIRNP